MNVEVDIDSCDVHEEPVEKSNKGTPKKVDFTGNNHVKFDNAVTSIDMDTDDESKTPKSRKRSNSTSSFKRFLQRSRSVSSSDEDSDADDSNHGCSPFSARRGKTFLKKEVIFIEAVTTINIANMTPGSNIIFPGSTDSSGANIPGSNINIVLVCNNGELKNLDASQLDLQKLLLGSAGVRGSYRQTKTRLKKKSSSSGIQADSSGLSESVAGLHDDDSDGPAFEVNESPIDDINDFKTLMNTIQNSGEDANIEVTEIKKSEDGEISISWKVLVNKITEHKDSNYAIAIPKVVFVIAMCTFLIVGVMFMLYFMGTRL